MAAVAEAPGSTTGPLAGGLAGRGTVGSVNTEEHEVSRAIPKMPHAPAAARRPPIRLWVSSVADRPLGRFHPRSIGALPSPQTVHPPQPGSRDAIKSG